MLALAFSNNACLCCLFLRLRRRSEPGLINTHEPTTCASLHTGFGFTSTIKTVTLAMQILSVLSHLLFSCTILLVHVFLLMNDAGSCLQRSAAQLKAFCPQKQHWNNISSEQCCKACKSVRVINEVPLDSSISKAFYNKIMLFMKQSLVCT